MVPPPWHLVSPAGVVHVVHDEVQLRALAESESEELIVRRENLLRKLVDPDSRMALNQLPVHKKHWQLLQRVVWLERVDNGYLLPIIGGAWCVLCQ